MEFEELKQKVIEAILGTTTKSFFRQACRIVSIEGDSIVLDVNSRFLYDIAKKQQADIELGFSVVYDRPMTITNIMINKEKETKPYPITDAIYQHYNGNLYRVICVAKETETAIEYVVYQCCATGTNYARPLVSFIEEWGGKPRFTFHSKGTSKNEDRKFVQGSIFN